MKMATLTCTLQLSRKKQKSKNEFKNSLIRAIDECLSLFSTIDKRTVYSVLEKDYGMRKEEIPYRIESFADALEQMLGIGAKLVEIGIIENLHREFPKFIFFSKNGDLCFTEYLTSMRESLVQTF